jgi:hypothetical protein
VIDNIGPAVAVARCYAARQHDEAQAQQRELRGDECTMVSWTIKARDFTNCNCAYGCPYQFNARPTQGNCKAILVYDIEEGITAPPDLTD